jgi:radical SAM protein with 4Fe4S-binding SPASM domain
MTNAQMLRNCLELLAGNGFRFSFDRIPLRYPRLDSRRRNNLLLAGADQLLGRARMLAAPPVLQVEPTNVCNLSCPLCPSQTMSRPKGMMALETFDAILRGAGDTLLLAILYGWGEPFLNASLPGMIARCRDKGILTLTSTNGHRLQAKDQALEVVDAGLSALIVAVDGSTQESYSAYRKNGSLEHVMRCAGNVVEAKARRNSATPFVNLRLVANRHNEDEIGTMEDLAKSLGVNMFSVKSLGCLPDRAEFTSFLPGSPDMRRFGAERKKVPLSTTFRCRYPFRQPTIFWDGTLVGCEFDYESSAAWGNVNDRPFRELWNTAAARKMRGAVREWTERPDFCGQCPYVGRGKNSSIVSSVVFDHDE